MCQNDMRKLTSLDVDCLFKEHFCHVWHGAPWWWQRWGVRWWDMIPTEEWSVAAHVATCALCVFLQDGGSEQTQERRTSTWTLSVTVRATEAAPLHSVFYALLLTMKFEVNVEDGQVLFKILVYFFAFMWIKTGWFWFHWVCHWGQIDLMFQNVSVGLVFGNIILGSDQTSQVMTVSHCISLHHQLFWSVTASMHHRIIIQCSQ